MFGKFYGFCKNPLRRHLGTQILNYSKFHNARILSQWREFTMFLEYNFMKIVLYDLPIWKISKLLHDYLNYPTAEVFLYKIYLHLKCVSQD